MQQYNPYAAPSPAAQQQMGAPQAGAGAPQPWEIGEVLGLGFEAVKKDWVVLVFAPIVVGFMLMLPYGAALYMFGWGGIIGTILGAIFALVTLALGAFVAPGLIKIHLAAARGESPEFGLLFSGGDRLLPFLGAYFLMGIAVSIGYVFLIVPGVILALGLSLTFFFVVDQNMGPIDALKASWETTTGHKGAIFLFGLAAFGILLISELMCFLPVLFTYPLVIVAYTTAYLRMSGRGGPAAAAGGFGPAPGAPPGFGAPQGFGGAPGAAAAAGFGGPAPGMAPPAGGGFGGPPGGAPPAGGFGGPQGGAPPAGGFGGPQGGAPPAGGGFGGPPPGGAPPGGAPPGGAPPAGGGFGGPPPGGAPPGGGYPPPGGGAPPGGGYPPAGGGAPPGGGYPPAGGAPPGGGYPPAGGGFPQQ